MWYNKMEGTEFTRRVAMKIYDISQEVFNCAVYPGDPSPQREIKMSMNDGAVCNLTALSMCAHNGTHVDAPYHFINDGKTIDQVSLEKFVGNCYVAEHEGVVTAEDAEKILQRAGGFNQISNRNEKHAIHHLLGGEAAGSIQEEEKKQVSKACFINNSMDAAKRILIKGKAEVSAEAARVFAETGVWLIGNESQTVGPENAPMEVHLILLGAEVVLLEGIRLAEVPEGVYLLNAAPLNLGGTDGAPCRAILLDMKE